MPRMENTRGCPKTPLLGGECPVGAVSGILRRMPFNSPMAHIKERSKLCGSSIMRYF
jgi:hypothetical protein